MELDLLRKKIDSNLIHTVIYGEIQGENQQQKATFFHQKLSEIRLYVDDLHQLIEKLEHANQEQSLQLTHLKNEVKSALRYCEMMRHNVIHPLQPHQFTEAQAIEYRVLTKLYLKHEINLSSKNPSATLSPSNKNSQPKDKYFTAIEQLAEYNQKLKENMELMAKYKKESIILQSLNGTISSLKQQNYFMKKQNILLQERGENYLSIKKLCESQQNLIKNLQTELDLKKQQLRELIDENMALNDRLHFYKDDDLESEKKLARIKADFVKYFESKKQNLNNQDSGSEISSHQLQAKFY